MELKEEYTLHPSVRVIEGVSGKIIVESPDGERLSLNSAMLPLKTLFQNLKQKKAPFQDLDELMADPRINDAMLKLVKDLAAKGILVNPDQDEFFSCDLHAMYEYVSDNAVRGEYHGYKRNRIAQVVGEGVIYNAARSLINKLGWAADENSDLDNTADAIKIVCADFENFTFFCEENGKSVKDEQITLYLWKSGARILLGPIVYPGETACFNCYRGRLESNVQFVDEFRDIIQYQGDSNTLSDNNDLITGISNSMLFRNLFFIFDKVPNLALPNTVYSMHLITGESKTQPVLKLPRCSVCGRAREDKLSRAVRDLL